MRKLNALIRDVLLIKLRQRLIGRGNDTKPAMSEIAHHKQ